MRCCCSSGAALCHAQPQGRPSTRAQRGRPASCVQPVRACRRFAGWPLPQPVYQAVQLEERPRLETSSNGASSNGKGPGGKGPDFYANLGQAIRTLREDIPLLFQKDLNCAPSVR